MHDCYPFTTLMTIPYITFNRNYIVLFMDLGINRKILAHTVIQYINILKFNVSLLNLVYLQQINMKVSMYFFTFNFHNLHLLMRKHLTQNHRVHHKLDHFLHVQRRGQIQHPSLMLVQTHWSRCPQKHLVTCEVCQYRNTSKLESTSSRVSKYLHLCSIDLINESVKPTVHSGFK